MREIRSSGSVRGCGAIRIPTATKITPVRSNALVPPRHLGPSHGFITLADSIDSTPAIVFATGLLLVSAATPVLRTRRVGIM